MGTKDSDIWCVFDAGAETSVRDLKRRFGAWMKFDNNMDANWENVSLEETLEKASEEHEGTLTLKEPSHYYKCNVCKQPVDCNKNTTLPHAPHCCQVYADNAAPMSMKATRTTHNKASKKEAQLIVGLRINEAPKSGGTQTLLPQRVPADWRWNGNCGCGQKALQRTSNAGVEFYCCFFGAVGDARCNLRYKPCTDGPGEGCEQREQLPVELGQAACVLHIHNNNSHLCIQCHTTRHIHCATDRSSVIVQLQLTARSARGRPDRSFCYSNTSKLPGTKT